MRMGQEGGVREGLFGLLKGMGQRRGPGKCFWRANEGIDRHVKGKHSPTSLVTTPHESGGKWPPFAGTTVSAVSGRRRAV